MSTQDLITGKAPGRYAQALLELAEESKSLKSVEKDVAKMKSVFAGSGPLRDALSNPVFATEDKVAVVQSVAMKSKVGKLITQFMGTAAKNRRASEIPAMLRSFEEQLADKRDSETATVISAKKLTAAELTKVKSELKKSLGKTVAVETQVDPTLLGGFVVKIGSRLYDSSLKTKLEDLKLALKEV
ncbi:MAG: F0F1 ATP synthase subunit delta [Hellea sp.]|nr:F0F1 ATP synthase subunit delta [Hellea sp.]